MSGNTFPPSGHRRLTAMAFGAVAVLALAACSSQTPGDAVIGPTQGAEGPTEPPGAALPLSIGGRALVDESDAYAGAIQCAAALDQTAQALALMSGAGSSPEIAQIRRAEDYFVDRAREASGPTQADAALIGAAVARRRAEKAGEVGEQAQLAIACLRRYGVAQDQAGEPDPNA